VLRGLFVAGVDVESGVVAEFVADFAKGNRFFSGKAYDVMLKLRFLGTAFPTDYIYSSAVFRLNLDQVTLVLAPRWVMPRTFSWFLGRPQTGPELVNTLSLINA
jgi:hypothetical protein